jgi:hypothetical protein
MRTAFTARRARWLADVHRQVSAGNAPRRRTREELAIEAWERDRANCGPAPTVAQLKAVATPTLQLRDVWHLALTDDVELRGRHVWSRAADWFDDAEPREPMTLSGVLAADITEEQFWQQVAEAYSK